MASRLLVVAAMPIEDPNVWDRAWSMFVTAHAAPIPGRRARASQPDRVVIYGTDPDVLRWIEHELFGEPVSPQFFDNVVDVVATLTLMRPPWPQILIVDVADISPADTGVLSTIRGAGWHGMVIAIGEPSAELDRSLGIDMVLDRTLGSELLRAAIKQVGMDRPTMPMRAIR